MTHDFAELVGSRLVDCIGKHNPHQQARYFVEVIILKLATSHPRVFAPILCDHMKRTDMAPQEVASFMVIVGNLFVGRFADSFLSPTIFGKEKVRNLRETMLSGVVPWLSSTQSFARGIAQLLAFKLIPLVVDVSEETSDSDGTGVKTSSWFLVAMYKYLLENKDARRLREKQFDLFSAMDVERMCSPQGLMSLPKDSSGEVNPPTMIDRIVDCLKVLMEENYEDFWIQFSDMPSTSNDTCQNTVALVSPSLQRKIVPVDALNLELENAKDQRLRNRAGRFKQELIICAALLDKPANLGGICRTAEVFAAERLVVPDREILKNEVFTALSVGALDWIEVEECKEKVSKTIAYSCSTA